MADTKEVASTTQATTAAAKDVAPASQPDIALIESLIEANVQRSLDSLDAWKLTAPFRGKDPSVSPAAGECTKAKHTCNLDADNVSALCVGCTLYKRIVHDRSAFPVGGRTDTCDYLAMRIAEPLIFAFIQNGEWLNPTAKLEGKWFVKHPITFHLRPQVSMVPAPQALVRRNRIHLFNGDELLNKLGLGKNKDVIYTRLHDYWHTESGGVIYSLDELLDLLNPMTQYALNAYRLGAVLDEAHDIDQLTRGIQALAIDSAK